jgi:hypothetical protein
MFRRLGLREGDIANCIVRSPGPTITSILVAPLNTSAVRP